MLFLKWEVSRSGVLIALFCEGSHVIAFNRAELVGPLARLYNSGWLAIVQTALSAHPGFSVMRGAATVEAVH